MKVILLVLVGLCYAVTINARLIERNTDRPTTETKTTSSSPPVRLTREVFEEDVLTGFSKEDPVQSDEVVRSASNRRARHFFKSKPQRSESPPIIRTPRDSNEKYVKNATSPSAAPAKQKLTLVKKPIPKYNELDYEEDFQMKISRSPVGVVDSGEHEDEDFNLDDYDFDVNHDEFIGRGKPLEPRTKHKEVHERPNRPASKHELKPAPSQGVKIQTKVHASPASHKTVSNKKERAVPVPKKSDKDDYYDDTTTTKSPEIENKQRDLDEEFNDDNEESKEFDGKLSSVRSVRSPWKITKMNSYIDKLGEKSTSVMSKVLSILPMFPQVPNRSYDEYLNDPLMDPWTGKLD